MVKIITNNFGWKVVSLLIAILLWFIVVNLEDPLVTTTIRGIPVEKQNENAITEQKKAIHYEAGDTVDVRVRGKRSVIYKLGPASIKAHADMENLSITNAVDIQVDLPNDVELVSQSPSSVLVSLEDIIRKKVEIQYVKEGRVEPGYVDLNPIIRPSVIELEAAESIIYKIDKVVVAVNIDGLSEDLSLQVAPLIYDYFGDLVQGIWTSVGQVTVSVPVQKTKRIPISFEPLGQVGEDYAYLGATLSQDRVEVRGRPELIDKLYGITINHIDIQDMTGKQLVIVNLAKLLADGVNLNQDYSTIEVEINIEPIITKEFEFNLEEVEIQDLGQDKEVLFLNDGPLIVSYKGVESKIKALTKAEIKPSLSVKDRVNGIYPLLIEWVAPPELERISPDTQVTVEVISQDQNQVPADSQTSN